MICGRFDQHKNKRGRWRWSRAQYLGLTRYAAENGRVLLDVFESRNTILSSKSINRLTPGELQLLSWTTNIPVETTSNDVSKQLYTGS
jgi:hypothetical protein